MSLSFEWDPAKASSNLAKHGVCFELAATAFGDPRALVIPDPAHSLTEHRFILLGRRAMHSSLWLFMSSGVIESVSSAHAAPVARKEMLMPKPRNTADADMAAEYDFSKGTRGKYAARFAAGSNIAVIDKELAVLFPNSSAVNETLRLVAKLRQMPVKVASRPKPSPRKAKAAVKPLG